MTDQNEVSGLRELPIQIERALIERDGKLVGVYGIAVYAALCLYENLPDIHPSLNTIAGHLGISRNTVKSALGLLVKYQWITISPRFNTETQQWDSHRYLLLRRPEGVGQEMTQGRSGEVQDSTTSISDDGLNNVMLWNDNVNPLNGVQVDKLHALEELYDPQTVYDAIMEIISSKTAEQLRFITFAYLTAILERWRVEGRGRPGEDDGSRPPSYMKILT